MIWDKGIKEYVDCAKQMLLVHSELHFFLIGSGDQGNPKSIPRKWLQDVNENKGISWIEHIEDVKPWMVLADIIVLPSYYKEGVPRSLIEAASFEKPIITTDVPGCREVIHENGILIPPKDSKALYNAMLEMINTDKLKIWSENSFQLASKFDIHEVNQKTLSGYGVSV